jgi:RNA polymerase sigma-70 factor (ECF subfamily)
MDIPSEELAALAIAAQRGDAVSRDALIRVIRPAVLRYVLGRGLSNHDADDVTQEVCVAVLSAIDRWRDEGRPVWAIVFAIVRNKLADRGRQQVRQKEALYEDMTVHDRPRHDTPAELVERDESAAGVSDLLNSLPPTQRDVLMLRIIAGLSCAETAEALGLAAGSVRVIQYRGMTALRKRLGCAKAVAS